MFLEITAISFVLFYLIWLYAENFQNNEGRPPGPLRIPPFGNLIQIVSTHRLAHVALHDLAKKYGDVMSIKMGLMDSVIFSSYESVRQVFTKSESYGRVCSGFMWDRNLQQNIGMGMAEGPEWIESRSFCRSSLRNYGYGDRGAMKNIIVDELTVFCKCISEEVKSNSEGRVHVDSDYFHRSFMNIMSTLVMGQRFNYSDPEFQSILMHENELMKNGALGAGVMMAFPFLSHIFPEALGYNAQMKGVYGFHKVAKNFLRKRKEHGLYKTNPTCFTDDFLNKMDKTAHDPQSLYSENHYAALFADILQAGTDTTSNVVNFIILHLTVNPTIQEKVYDEIVTTIGVNRSPDIEDKLLMPYTQAVLLEGLRWSRVVVMGVPRKATEDFIYRNYQIKKGTALMFNLQTIFFNEEYWGDPQVFRPERFFDENGNIDSNKMDRIVAFGAGKRICFGEVLARDSMFIFITTLVQKFKFVLPTGTNPNLEPQLGLSLYVQPYDANITCRDE